MPLRMVAWEGYEEIIKGMGLDDLIPLPQITRCPNSEAVVKAIENGGDWQLVTLDREHLSRVRKRLQPLENITPARIRATALPRLASLEYYGHDSQLWMLPVRFGMNGIIYTAEAKDWLIKAGCLRWNPASVTEVVDLVGLVEAAAKCAEGERDHGAPEVYLWKFDTAVKLMLRRALRNSPSWNQNRSFGEIWQLADKIPKLLTLEEVIRKLEEREANTIIIGPGDNACGPARYRRGDKGVEWTVAQGAGLLWLEGIAVNQGLNKKQDEEVREALEGMARSLEMNGFEHCCPTQSANRHYWGLPVLGWRPGNAATVEAERRKKIQRARERMGQLGYEERVEGFLRLPPEAAMGQFLDGAGLNGIGIALRGFPSPWDVRALKDSIAEEIFPDEDTARRILEVQGDRIRRGKMEEGVREGIEKWAEKLWNDAWQGGKGDESSTQGYIFDYQKFSWAVLSACMREVLEPKCAQWDITAKKWNVSPCKWIDLMVAYAFASEKWRGLREGGLAQERLKGWLELARCQVDVWNSDPKITYGLTQSDLQDFILAFCKLGKYLAKEDAVTLGRIWATEALEKLCRDLKKQVDDPSTGAKDSRHDIMIAIEVLLFKIHGTLEHKNNEGKCLRCVGNRDLQKVYESWGVSIETASQ